MSTIFLAAGVGGGLALGWAGACCVKLKDYVMPQYGLADGVGQEDLSQYSLKNFDLKAYQRAQQQQDAAPMGVSPDPYLLQEDTGGVSAAPAAEAPSPSPLDASPWTSAPAQPDEPSFGHAPSPTPTEVPPLALDASEVRFGPHFDLQQPLYIPPSPSQSWKLPRWVVTTVGLFFGSAAVLTFACCVVLLRDAPAAPTAPLAAATAAVATTPAPSAARDSSPAATRPAGDTTRIASERESKGSVANRAAVAHGGPAVANLMHDGSALPHRFVVSRHSAAVRRHAYGPRHFASKSASSPVVSQQTETANRPPKDALDQLLSESTL